MVFQFPISVYFFRFGLLKFLSFNYCKKCNFVTFRFMDNQKMLCHEIVDNVLNVLWQNVVKIRYILAVSYHGYIKDIIIILINMCISSSNKTGTV